MDDVRDPLFASGLQRQAVLCPRCGSAWDDRLVAADSEDAPASLCLSCLLTTSHGDPFPDDPTGEPRGARQTRDV